jgi:hypothetical protein
MIFPNYFRIDYVRVYQNSDGTIGCDPDDHPTADYISQFAEVYANPNLTTWEGAGQWSILRSRSPANGVGYTFPKNTLSGC